jgi:hypothetical protein
MWDAFQIGAAALAKTDGKGGTALVDALQSLGKFSTLSGGPGTYVNYSATQHSGLFGPHLMTVYTWDAATKAFAADSALTTIADSSPGVNG